jgi:hypothetical protein
MEPDGKIECNFTSFLKREYMANGMIAMNRIIIPLNSVARNISRNAFNTMS